MFLIFSPLEMGWGEAVTVYIELILNCSCLQLKRSDFIS